MEERKLSKKKWRESTRNFTHKLLWVKTIKIEIEQTKQDKKQIYKNPVTQELKKKKGKTKPSETGRKFLFSVWVGS